jgi:hypothetical protein
VVDRAPARPAEFDNPEAKRSVSLRLNQSDHDRIRTIAKRLRARESDVFRFLLRIALAEITPLDNIRNAGSELLPAFVNYAAELATHFQLDADRMHHIINKDASETNRVDDADIEMLAMAGTSHRYLAMRVAEFTGEAVRPDDVLPAMRDYLERKYLQRAGAKKFAVKRE